MTYDPWSDIRAHVEMNQQETLANNVSHFHAAQILDD